jgi:hypothetical protein
MYDLNDEEIQKTKELLSRLTPGQLPPEIFLEFARLIVTPVLEVVPLRSNQSGQIEVLLIMRDDSDPIWGGKLHTPGTIIRASDQAASDQGDAFNRILEGELESVATGYPVYVTSILHKVKRGTEQALVYWVELIGEPTVGQFFDVNQLPDSLVDTQVEFIKEAVVSFKRYLERGE